MRIEFLTKQTIDENMQCIIELYEDAFNRTITKKELKWRYIDNPIEDLLFVVCKDKGKIVASYSASPCIMIKSNEIHKTAISLNTMTHPDYQGKGLLVKLANKLYEYMKEKNYTMIWGFPNNISHRIFIDRLDWKTIYEVPTMTLKLDKLDKINPVDLTNDSNFQLDYSNLEKNQMKSIYVEKETEYLKWRYYNNPQNNYTNLVIETNNKVYGYIVFKEYDNIINIIDINYINLEDASTMISGVIEYSNKLHKSKVTVWAPINTSLHSYLEKIGFYNDYPIRYLAGRVLKPSKNNNDFLEYKNWFIHAGDNNEY